MEDQPAFFAGRHTALMDLPPFPVLMPYVEQVLEDGQPQSSADIRGAVANALGLDEAALSVTLNNGTPVFTNRVAWALVKLVQAGVVVKLGTGVYAKTSRTGTLPPRTQPTGEPASLLPPGAVSSTPLEVMSTAAAELRSITARDLLDRVVGGTPTFFEGLVLDLLLAMGYGGTREDAATRLGRGGDEGVDGVIQQDHLGLDLIYVQAKRWGLERAVGRPDVQAFVGALQGRSVQRGVMLTTARFTQEARNYVAAIGMRVALVDGSQLADLMIDYGVGVAVAQRFVTHRVDTDYFLQEWL